MKTILLFLLLCMSLSTSAQTADERAGTYMNQENWFSLQREFAVNKDSLHPFLQEFGQALLDNFFNRPQAAYESIGKLLNEQQSNMGFENTASMIYLLSENLSKLGANDQAAETLKNFCDQWKARWTVLSLPDTGEKKKNIALCPNMPYTNGRSQIRI